MKTLSLAVLFALLMLTAVSAQTVDPLPATAPTIVIGGALGVSPYAEGQKFSGVGTFALRIAGTNLWSWSTLQMVPGVTAGAILRTGAAYTCKAQGAWTLTAIVDAGVATGAALTLGTFSGGGVISYTLSESKRIYATAGMALNITPGSNVVQPSFGIGFAKGF